MTLSIPFLDPSSANPLPNLPSPLTLLTLNPSSPLSHISPDPPTRRHGTGVLLIVGGGHSKAREKLRTLIVLILLAWREQHLLGWYWNEDGNPFWSLEAPQWPDTPWPTGSDGHYCHSPASCQSEQIRIRRHKEEHLCCVCKVRCTSNQWHLYGKFGYLGACLFR